MEKTVSPPPAPADPLSTTPLQAAIEHQHPSHKDALYFAFLRRDLPAPSKAEMTVIVCALCLMMILIGWGAGCIGPLVPFLQDYYQINYIIFSIVFVTNFVGSLFSGLLNMWLSDHFGYGLTVLLGAVTQAIGYALMSFGGPYPLFAIMYGVVGFGFALTDAQVNGLSARLPNADRDVFIIQACFGLGALISPLISTAFVQAVPKAYTFFAVALGISVVAAVVAVVVFKGRTTEQILQRNGTMTPRDQESKTGESSKTDVATPAEPVRVSTTGEKMRRMIKMPRAWILVWWTLFYVGAEVALGSWATTYLIREKGGDETAGYVTTGYYAGLTLGRILLMPFSGKVGHHVAVQTFTVASLVFQILAWLIPSLYASAVFISLVGLAFGPMWPAMLMVVVEIFDDEIQDGIMGFLGAMAGAGAAIMPFAIGALSDRYGIWTLQPFCIAMEGICFVLWACIPARSVFREWVRRYIKRS